MGRSRGRGRGRGRGRDPTANEKQLTPTQERNARKRAAKKKAKQAVRENRVNNDPSLKYISAPLKVPVVFKARDFFRESCGIERLAVHVGPLEGWRTEAKLAVRSAGAAGVKIGLFLPGTHEICRINGCPAHHPAIDDALVKIEAACRSVGLKGYDEMNGQGDLRYVQMSVQRASRSVQLTIVWNAVSAEAAGPSLQKFVDELLTSDIWYSIWVNFNAASKHVSRILEFDACAWQHFGGRKKPLREQLSDYICPYAMPKLCFPPFVFRQANLCAFEGIVAAIRKFVEPHSKIIELYGGVGTIGLHLADLAASLVCSDENPHNKDCFERSLKSLPDELAQKLTYVSGDATSQVPTLKKAHVVIVDPPRKGLDEPVLVALESPPKRIRRLIYVSCGFPAFQRDAWRLLAAGWSVAHAEGFVLFPGADHVETLCVFDRPVVAVTNDANVLSDCVDGEGEQARANKRQKR